MKKVIYIIVAILIIIQFIPANLPEISTDNHSDLLTNNPNISDEVALILKTSCYDCHSNETYYPWYSYIASISFLVSRDTKVGRENHNCSDWESYKKTDKAGAFNGISDAISEGEMPMKIYTFIHRGATLSDDEIEIMVNWANESGESLFE